jgi:hypothetical protein
MIEINKDDIIKQLEACEKDKATLFPIIKQLEEKLKPALILYGNRCRHADFLRRELVAVGDAVGEDSGSVSIICDESNGSLVETSMTESDDEELAKCLDNFEKVINLTRFN